MRQGKPSAAANETRGGEMPGRIRDGRSAAGCGGEAENAKPERMRTAVQGGGRGRQASGGSPAAERGGGTAGEDERIGAAGPFPFPHRRKGFAERCALPARRPVSFLRRRTPALSGRPCCRAVFLPQTVRRGRSLRRRAFRMRQSVPSDGPPHRPGTPG